MFISSTVIPLSRVRRQLHLIRPLVSKSNNISLSKNNTNNHGLFSIPNLHQPSDFLKLAHQAIQTCNDLRQQIHNSLLPSSSSSSSSSTIDTKLTPRQTLYILDDISNTVCSIIDASELCRSVHSSPTWRSSASQSFQLLSEYIADLNADELLYDSLLPITTNDQIYNFELDEEERRMATLLKKEFERDGIHLSKEKRDDVKELNGYVTQLETMFSENLVKVESFELGRGDGSDLSSGRSSRFRGSQEEEQALINDVFEVIPKHVLMSQQQEQRQGTFTTSLFDNDTIPSLTLSTEPHITNTLLRHSPSSRLRQRIFMETNTCCEQNLQVLDALIKQRHQLATTIGYPSYAHYFTSDKMAGNPNQVIQFLKKVGNACEKRYRKDMELLLNAKKHIEGRAGGELCSEDGGMVLHPWDMNFYNGLVKAHLYQSKDDNDNDDGSSPTSLSGYFTVDQSFEGMKILVQRLFGIAMEEVKTLPEEQWDLDHYDHMTNNDSKSMIRKFDFFKEEDGSSLGTIYFDLHPRKGKYAHAAHFTIRCGCEARDSHGVTIDDNNYQLPIVAVVCNLSPPFSNNESTTSVLSHSEVETLFHEFGHALHSLLSRTKFQHLSGTRAAMDFVETPSHLMEYFVWNETFLNIIGRHYITGEPIPKTSIDTLVQSKNLFKAIDIKTQVVYGLFDQTIFGSPENWKGENGLTSTTDVFAALHREHDVPYADGTHWHSKFGHLVTYGAGYYSYLYASIFSADLWNTCFAGGTKAFSSDAGLSYWKQILVHGGAKDPNEMLRTILGRDPKADEFFKF